MTIGIAIAILEKDRDRDRDLNFGDRVNALLLTSMGKKYFIGKKKITLAAPWEIFVTARLEQELFWRVHFILLREPLECNYPKLVKQRLNAKLIAFFHEKIVNDLKNLFPGME